MDTNKRYFLAVLGVLIISFAGISFAPNENESSSEVILDETLQSKPSLPENINIHAKAKQSNVTKSNAANLQFRRKILIDPIAFRKALSVLDIPITIGARDTEKEAREFSVLADLYPDELLIQFFAAVSCTAEKFKFCNTELYIDRMRALAPENALADKFLFKHHLDNNDLVSALDILENVSPKAYYDNYFPETTSEIYRQINNGEWKPDNMPKQFNSLAFIAVGFSAMKIPRPNIIVTCAKQSKQSVQRDRWLAACYQFGKVLTASTTHFSKSLGLSLQKMHLKSDNQNVELQQIDEQELQLNDMMREFGQLSETEFFNRPENLEIWLKDLKNYGEIIATQKFIERYRKSN